MNIYPVRNITIPATHYNAKKPILDGENNPE